MMNRDDIMKILPHRDNMLLLDSIEEIEGVAIGHYYVKGDEFFLKGHFPNNPIVPGVILCEILAQSACILLKDKLKKNCLPFYTGLNNVKFRAPVKPQEEIITHCSIVREKHPFYFAKGTITVKDQLCASAEFSFCIKGD